jgi:DNA-binding beta-propeller fold protein YncE
MKQQLLLSLWLALLVSCSAPATVAVPVGPPPTLTTVAGLTPTMTQVVDPAFGNAVLFTRYDRQRDRHALQPVNPETGQVLTQYAPIEISRNVAHAFAPDGGRLAIVNYNFPNGGAEVSGGAFYSIDLRTWQTVTTTLRLDDYAHAIAFRPDGAQVAFVYGRPDRQTLVVMDARQPRLIAERSLPLQPARLAWSADGGALLMYGSALQKMGLGAGQSRQRVLKVRAIDLETTWEAELPDVLDGIWCVERCAARDGSAGLVEWHAGEVFTEDKRQLLVAHPDSDTLTTVDWVAQQLTTAPVHVARGLVEQALALSTPGAAAKNMGRGGGKVAILSPDGRQLYVTQYTQRPADSPREPAIREYGPLQIVDWQARSMTLRPDLRYAGMQPAVDGATAYWFPPMPEQGSKTVDARSFQDLALKHSATLDRGVGLSSTRRLNGAPILLGVADAETTSSFMVLDPGSFAPLHAWKVEGYANWLVP